MAGRIPQTFIDDLLNRLDIVDIVDSRVKLKKTGRNYSACCPFHQEKTPSFTVSPEKQFYYCFGCGASGNAMGFVMDFDHLDFPAAVDSLASLAGLEVPREQSNQKRGPDHSPLYELMNKANHFYNEQLRKAQDAPRAIQYLKQRGLDGQTCKRFGIGFAPPGWNNLQNHLSENQEKEDQLVTTGMLVEKEETKSRYDRFRDRIMFPIHDTRGRIIAFGGRVLGDAKPKYLNSPESPIFHKGRELYGLYEAKKHNRHLERILVVEGYMDVVALAQQGINNAVATLGTATTLDHMQRLFKTVSEIVFCFDGDDAGRRAAWRALESTLPYMEDGKQARFLFLPQGEDPDSMVRQEGSDAFLERIKSTALSLDTFLFKELSDGIDLNTMDGRSRLATDAQPHLHKIPDGLFKQMLMQRLSEITGLNTDTLETYLNKKNDPEPVIEKPTYDNYSVPAEADYYSEAHYEPDISHNFQPQERTFERKPFKKGFKEKNEQPVAPAPLKVGRSIYAIRHLLCNPELATAVKAINELEGDEHPDTQLLIALIKTLQEQPKLPTIALIAQWHGTQHGIRLQEIASLELGHQPNDEEFHEAIERIRDTVRELEHKQAAHSLKQTFSQKKPGQIDSAQRSVLEALLEKKKKKLGIKPSTNTSK
ncbi:DNA primase [Endozoicomonas numazuensis]|uniref:DNA primase n=1 Tax=Endozoicomonas numazuensis TaxID=1137799 RepID=A0A081NET5_9GAMM|nr:DNA primase [Endozoicomonas numazuensis]KEQ16958.1 DNA primase [Endozoicomonas numazuensis]